jgi:hypothetical protein
MDEMKQCRKCKQYFPATVAFFHRHKGRKDGFQSYCKKCASLHNEQWRKDNPEKKHALGKAYRKHHPEKQSQWRKDNPEKVRAYEAVYRKRDPDRNKTKAKRRREKPEQYRAAELAREHRRSARKRSLPAQFTSDDWRIALAYFGNTCAVCGRPRGLWHTLAADHWIPLTNPNCPGTVPGNIVPLCHGQDGCNNIKGSRDPHEWLVAQFGPRKAARIEARIAEYFRSLSRE